VGGRRDQRMLQHIPIWGKFHFWLSHFSFILPPRNHRAGHPRTWRHANKTRGLSC
jgi:hypothetical protein